MFSVSAVVLVAVLLAKAASECETPFTERVGSCYYFETFKVHSANLAEKFCSGLHGYLVNIGSSEEQKYIEDTAQEIYKNASTTPEDNVDGYWTGGVYNEATKEWVWKQRSEETPIAGGYQKWESIWEPDNENGKPLERNLGILRLNKKPWSWSSEDGNSPNLWMGFICEHNPR